MSSLATRQTAVLLSVINGAFILLDDREVFDEMSDDIHAVRLIVSSAIQDMPGIADTFGNRKWCIDKMNALRALMAEDGDDFTSDELINMSLMICVDLLDMISDKKKRSVLLIIVDVMTKLLNINDSDGLQFPVYERVDALLDKMYACIEFSNTQNHMRWVARHE